MPKKKNQDQPTGPPKDQTPYAGCIPGTGNPITTAPHLLVSGPTGSGKTVAVLAPNALLWQGPRVIVSSKTDFMKWLVVKGIAKRGPVYVMDLAGELDPNFEWLQDADYTPVVADPCSLIANDDDALAMASMLMKVGALGASDGGDSGGGNDAFWQTLAAQPLAALLLAGRESGKGIDWAVRAASKPEKDEGDDETTPCWANAADLIADISRHADDLIAVAGMDPKLKDSLTATMKSGLTPWLLTNVRGKPGAVPFSPSMLEGPGEPTLAIIAPADGVAAGAAVGAIETVIRHWRRGIERGLDRVLLSVDEAVNTAPLPKLPTYITEARGLGVACVIAVQSTNQMELRWGQTGAKVLREVFPAALILRGAPEKEMLENAVWWKGEETRWNQQISHDQKVSLSEEKAPAHAATQYLPKKVDTKAGEERRGTLVLYGDMDYPGSGDVELPGIWNF